MVEKTDVLREAVFACGSVDALPLNLLEDLPALCARLPSRSRAVGVRRLQFVLGPIKTTLMRELHGVLAKTGRWPMDAQKKSATAAGTAAMRRAVRLLPQFSRAQSAMQRVDGLANGGVHGFVDFGGATAEKNYAATCVSWGAEALASPLMDRFAYHFCRPESDLCRMDKPEWAFRFLTELCADHCDELQAWFADALTEDGGTRPPAGQAHAGPNVETLRALDAALPAALVLVIAREAQVFVRARMPLLADASERAILFHTIGQLVRFRESVAEIGGDNAAKALFADFDANRPLPDNANGATGSVSAAPPGESDVGSSGVAPSPSKKPSGLLAARLAAGFSKELTAIKKGVLRAGSAGILIGQRTAFARARRP